MSSPFVHLYHEEPRSVSMVPNDVPVGSPGLALISILNKLLRSKQVFFNLNSQKKCGSQSKSHLIKQTSSDCFSQCNEVFSFSLFMMDTHGCTCITIISSSTPGFYWLNNQVSCGFKDVLGVWGIFCHNWLIALLFHNRKANCLCNWNPFYTAEYSPVYG